MEEGRGADWAMHWLRQQAKHLLSPPAVRLLPAPGSATQRHKKARSEARRARCC